MHNRRLLIFGSICLIVLFLSAAFISACSNGTSTPPHSIKPGTISGSAPKTIKIGGSVPIQGGFAAPGYELWFGYTQAVLDINAKGGIYVKEFGSTIPIELVLEDDQSDWNLTQEFYTQFANEGNFTAFLGSYGGELNGYAAAIAEYYGIPMVATIPTLSLNQSGYQYLFTPCVKTESGADAFFKLLGKLPQNQRPTKLAVWAEDTLFGAELKTVVTKLATQYNYKIVYEGDYYSESTIYPNVMTIDFTPLIQGAQSAGAEVVFAAPTPTTAYNMVVQMKQAEYSPGAMVFFRGAASGIFGSSLGRDSDGICYVSDWDQSLRYPGCEHLVDVYSASREMLPGPNVGMGYTVVQVLADAIERAGSLDHDKIREALALTKNLMTVQGKFERFTDQNSGINPFGIMQWQNVEPKVVSHPNYTNGSFLYPMPKLGSR
jgi:branched-chain amino acid transport system substrate-binding protein